MFCRFRNGVHAGYDNSERNVGSGKWRKRGRGKGESTAKLGRAVNQTMLGLQRSQMFIAFVPNQFLALQRSAMYP